MIKVKSGSMMFSSKQNWLKQQERRALSNQTRLVDKTYSRWKQGVGGLDCEESDVIRSEVMYFARE